jgi:hypothetical protein
MSPLCSIGPSFADHLGNNSEQPGSVLEAESTTLFSCSTSLARTPSSPIYYMTTHNPNCSSAEVQPTPSYTLGRLILLDPSGCFTGCTHTAGCCDRNLKFKQHDVRFLPLLLRTTSSPDSVLCLRTQQAASSNHLCFEQLQLPCFSLLLSCKPRAAAPFTTTTDRC